MQNQPDWWRGQVPAESPRGGARNGVQEGSLSDFHLPAVQEGIGLRDIHAFGARVAGAELSLTDVQLTVEWSEFHDCRFTQAVKPVLNHYGVAAQGSFAISPAVYRNCTFHRIRFKQLGGFSLGHATFEDCVFVDCRWEGHFAHNAWLINNRFVGRMNGCAWFGRGDDGVNLIEGNDFTQAAITTNTGFREGFPVDKQAWPPDYYPSVDDPPTVCDGNGGRT